MNKPLPKPDASECSLSFTGDGGSGSRPSNRRGHGNPSRTSPGQQENEALAEAPVHRTLHAERTKHGKRNFISRMLVSEKFKDPAVETEFGLHPRVSVLLLFSAVVLAIFAALLPDNRTHQVFALLQGMIFGLLFSPQMRVWYRRSNAPKAPTVQAVNAAPEGSPPSEIQTQTSDT